MNGPNNRGSARRTEPPRRVTNAAEQMRNTSSQGTFRGYVPQQTGSQRPAQYAVPPQNPGWNGQRGAVMSAGPVKPKKKSKAWLVVLVTVLRDGAVKTPTGALRLEAGDQVVVYGLPEALEGVKGAFGQ